MPYSPTAIDDHDRPGQESQFFQQQAGTKTESGAPVIGEAVKKLPEEFKAESPRIEWRKKAATRDRVNHGYFSVDFEIVWDVVVNKDPRST